METIQTERVIGRKRRGQDDEDKNKDKDKDDVMSDRWRRRRSLLTPSLRRTFDEERKERNARVHRTKTLVTYTYIHTIVRTTFNKFNFRETKRGNEREWEQGNVLKVFNCPFNLRRWDYL